MKKTTRVVKTIHSRWVQSPSFWILQVILCFVCVILAFHYYPKAFPIIDLKISMDRSGALQRAGQIARQHGWGPKEFRQAASFEVDQQTQTFVELSEGGSGAFARILKEGIYSPYTWRVRHFAEGQTTETEVTFTPTGEFYGFAEHLPENEPGAALEISDALKIAENKAKSDWNIDFTPFHLVEKSHEERPSKRVDHSFVYERTHEKIGDGKYRLILSVSGDRLTAIQYYIQIPDAFARRYAEMRSANDTIAILASIGMIVLYFLGGCGVGLFFLARKRWVIWKTPLIIGGVVAAFQFFEQLNQLPLSWMQYDTAVPINGFLIKFLASAVLLFLSEWFLLSVSFMAAESLSRRAFPHHPQLWKLWQTSQASTLGILGRTVGGYLTVGLFFVYVVLAYFVGTRYFGWWSPSDTLFQPNTFSSFCPWFTSIALSLHAGFWEESLFRAVPIAGAALLGARFGRPKFWLVGGFLVQALIFGAGHANYPAQPSYARVVELILPSFLFGGLYLRFGLLPGIILHFTFDVISFAIPLFVAATPGVWVDRGLIVLLTLVPLWIVLLARYRQGRWKSLSAAAFNESWTPAESQVHQKKLVEIADHQALSHQKNRRPLPDPLRHFIIASGLICLLGAVYYAATYDNKIPSLNLDRNQAISIARRALVERGEVLSPEWQGVALTTMRMDDEDRFTWETEGKDHYYQFIGNYLTSPSWMVRFIRFDRNVADRAEEYQVFVTHDGRVTRVRHQLPEEQAGATLTVEEAKKIALQSVREIYDLNENQVRDVSSVASQLLHRKDWLFIFSDPATVLKKGEARVGIHVAGDKTTATRQFIFAPEDWSRAQRSRENSANIIESLSFLIIGALFFAGIIQSVIQWTQKKYDPRAFRKALVVLCVISAIDFVNSFPTFFGRLSTTEPFFNQMLTFVALKIMKIFVYSLFLSLVVGWVHEEAKREIYVTNPPAGKRRKYHPLGLAAMAYSLGLVGPTIIALCSKCLPAPLPLFGRLVALDKFWPILSGIQLIEKYALSTLFFSILTLITHRLTAGWARRPLAGLFLITGVGLALVGVDPDNVSRWLVLGLLDAAYLIVVYRYLLQFNLSLIPLMTAAIFVLLELKQVGLDAYAGSGLHAVFNILLILGASLLWHLELRRKKSVH